MGPPNVLIRPWGMDAPEQANEAACYVNRALLCAVDNEQQVEQLLLVVTNYIQQTRRRKTKRSKLTPELNLSPFT